MKMHIFRFGFRLFPNTSNLDQNGCDVRGPGFRSRACRHFELVGRRRKRLLEQQRQLGFAGTPANGDTVIFRPASPIC